jgi:hypothetical protein
VFSNIQLLKVFDPKFKRRVCEGKRMIGMFSIILTRCGCLELCKCGSLAKYTNNIKSCDLPSIFQETCLSCVPLPHFPLHVEDSWKKKDVGFVFEGIIYNLTVYPNLS